MENQDIVARRFNPKSLEVVENSFLLEQGVGSYWQYVFFSASDNGVPVYKGGEIQEQFQWQGRDGAVLETVGEPGNYRTFDLSGDARQLVVAIYESGSRQNLWRFDMSRQGLSKPCVIPVHPAAAGCFTYVYKVGRPIASPFESAAVNKGLHKNRTVAIATLPIIRNGLDGQGKNRAGEVFDLDPRKNEKSAVIDDLLQVDLSRLVAPADPSVPWRHLPGRTGKLKTAEDIIGCAGFDEITQLRPEWQLISQIVIPVDVFIPKLPLLLALHLYNRYGRKLL